MPPSVEQSYVADSVTSPLLGAEEKLLFTEDGEPIFVTGDEDERQPKELPKEVQELMDKLALQKVGELQVIDCPALESLKDGEWMTVAAESKDELDWETLWKDKIAWHQEATGGWGPPLKLQASIVTTKDACAVGDRGVLRHLLKEAWANSCNEAIFGSGGIRAIVNYKWTSYARAFTIAQLVCYSAWVLSFTGFVLLTNSGIQSEHRPAESARAGWHGPAHPTLAYALLLASTALMAPFAALEARTIWVYRSYYAKRQILADLMDLAIMLNHTAILGLVLYNAMSKASVEGDVDIDILIAVQVTLLWAKLPYFFKGFDLGRFAPIDTFEHVVWEARYMLLFILFMMFGFGVGYTTLFQKPEDVDPDVGQLAHSIITMFVICKGMGVNIKEMYESRHNVAVIIFFVAFEFLISIVMLNTLISIMVGAFDRMKETSIAETVMRRAGISLFGHGSLILLVRLWRMTSLGQGRSHSHTICSRVSLGS